VSLQQRETKEKGIMTKPTIDVRRAACRGQIVTSEDADYEAARKVYNGMIDRRPYAIVRAADVADVIAAVNFARDGALALSVRGGAHSVPGFGTNDEGIVIDLGRMRSVWVDAARRTARADGGGTWGIFSTPPIPSVSRRRAASSRPPA
jgi:FAD/FMN-containing dehydrogenase